MTINELRAKWESDIEAYDRAIEAFEKLPEYASGIQAGALVARATQRYIQQMSNFRAQSRELLFLFPAQTEQVENA